MTAPEPSAPWASVRVALIHGLGDKRIETGEEFETRCLGEFWAMQPSAKPKHRAMAFLPSTYHEFDAREHAAQRARGQFVTLVGDVDRGDHSVGEIEAAVRALSGPSAWLIHSTANAVAGDMRWRVIIPLERMICFHLWRDAQEALFNFMKSRGIEMDGVTQRPGQVSFLPNVPVRHDKTGQSLRDPHGRPLFYRRKSSSVLAPGLRLRSEPLLTHIIDLRRRRSEDEQLRERLRAQAERRRSQRSSADAASPIDAFNQSVTIADLFTAYGYEQSPRDPDDWRSPQQTSTSFATRIVGRKWISLSQSDASSGLGAAFEAGCYGDAFDLFAHYAHGGDRKAAFRAAFNERQAGDCHFTAAVMKGGAR